MCNINELALMTGLTTRTLRNYMKQGYLQGEKPEGVWQFSEEAIKAFLRAPAVRAALQAKRNGVVYDFLSDRRKGRSAMCVVLDLEVPAEGQRTLSEFFCEAVNRGQEVQMSFSQQGDSVRVILSGAAQSVRQILRDYDKWEEELQAAE